MDNLNASETEFHATNDIRAKILNELTVFADGAALLPNSLKNAFVKVAEDPAELATKGAIAFSLGAALGYLSKGNGKVALTAKAFGTVAGVAFIAEGLKPIDQASRIAWNAQNEQDLNRASHVLADGLSIFVADTVVQTPVAVAGAFAGSGARSLSDSIFSSKSISALEASSPLSLTELPSQSRPTIGTTLETKTLAPEKATQSHLPELTIGDPTGGSEVAPFIMPRLKCTNKAPQQLNFKYAESTPSTPVTSADVTIGIQQPQSGGLVLELRNSYTRAAVELPAADLPPLNATVALPSAPSGDALIAAAVLANRSSGRRLDPHILEFLITGKRPGPELAIKIGLDPRVSALRSTIESQKGSKRKIGQIQNILEGQTPEPSAVSPNAGNSPLIPLSKGATNIQKDYAIARPQPAEQTNSTVETMLKPADEINGHDISKLMRKPAGQLPLRFTVSTAEKPAAFDFGVEITEPKLLKPGQPNLDHHITTGTADRVSAIEQALALPQAKLPKPGATLGTVKPDADSVGGMAVLCARLEGKVIDSELVSCIGKRDRGLMPPGSEPARYREAMNSVSWLSSQPRYELSRRVELVKKVLTGEVEPEILAKLSRNVEHKRAKTFERHESRVDVTTDPTNKVALVQYPSKALMTARTMGLEAAEVAVVQRHDSNYIQVITRGGSDAERYMPRAMKRLETMEPGWRGRPQFMLNPPDGRMNMHEVASVIRPYINPSLATRLMWGAQDFAAQPLSCMPHLQLTAAAKNSLPVLAVLYSTKRI